MIIGITGKARHGKSTLAQMMKDAAKEIAPNTVVTIGSLSKPFKEFWMDVMGIADETVLEELKPTIAHPYTITHREALEQLGDWGRAIGKNFWLDSVERRLIKTGLFDVIILPDVRVEDEATWVRERGVMVHVSSENLPTIDSTHTVQTTPLDVYEEDVVVYNNGTLEVLQHIASNVMLDILSSRTR